MPDEAAIEKSAAVLGPRLEKDFDSKIERELGAMETKMVKQIQAFVID